MQTALSSRVSVTPSFTGKAAAQQQHASRARLVVRAEKAAAPAEEPKVWSAPALNPNTPSPIFGGSTGARCSGSRPHACGPLQTPATPVDPRARRPPPIRSRPRPDRACAADYPAGGLLRQAQVEEFHVITWESKKEQIFEMPTGGAAIMRQGPNLLKLARKEQCLALLTQLRTKFKTDGAIYRVFPNGEVQYLHPKDGVYPEKVNAGRVGVNENLRRIGQNVNPVSVKFTGKVRREQGRAGAGHSRGCLWQEGPMRAPKRGRCA
jgi:photosystem I subunit 2